MTRVSSQYGLIRVRLDARPCHTGVWHHEFGCSAARRWPVSAVPAGRCEPAMVCADCVRVTGVAADVYRSRTFNVQAARQAAAAASAVLKLVRLGSMPLAGAADQQRVADLVDTLREARAVIAGPFREWMNAEISAANTVLSGRRDELVTGHRDRIVAAYLPRLDADTFMAALPAGTDTVLVDELLRYAPGHRARMRRAWAARHGVSRTASVDAAIDVICETAWELLAPLAGDLPVVIAATLPSVPPAAIVEGFTDPLDPAGVTGAVSAAAAARVVVAGPRRLAELHVAACLRDGAEAPVSSALTPAAGSAPELVRVLAELAPVFADHAGWVAAASAIAG